VSFPSGIYLGLNTNIFGENLLSKKILLVTTLGILQLIALFSSSAVQSANSTTTILLSPKIIPARVGSTIAVDLVVDNVTDLGGWFVSIRWNPKIVKLTTGDPNGTERYSIYLNVYEGPFLKDHGATWFGINTLDQASGKLEFGEIFKLPGVGVTGNGVVASMNFTILDFGFTTLQISTSVLGDKENRMIIHDAQNSSVCIFSICVDDDNSLGPWDGSLDHPYQNITSALQNSSENDAIFVREGTYAESFAIDKTIVLVGEDKATTVIDGGCTGTPVTVVADHANVSRFTIQNGSSIPHITYGIDLLNCQHVTISDNIILHNDIGIGVNNVNDSTITGNSLSDNWRGMSLSFAWLNQVLNNTIFGSEEEGISMGMEADSNTVYNNEVSNNSLSGISIGWSRGNYVAANKLTWNNEAGIRLDSADNNTIAGNQFDFNAQAGLALYGSNFNTIDDNEIAGNNWNGIAVWYSNSNIIYHNNFFNNSQQTTSGAGSLNIWDTRYPSGGNFWSDFPAPDFWSGMYQNETTSDGICDSPRVIDEVNVDHYPLAGAFASFVIVNNGTEYQVDVEGNSTISGLSFDNANGSLNFKATGQNETMGFCRVTVPKSLAEPTATERWALRVDNRLPLSSNILQDVYNAYLFMSYEQSTHEMSIKIINGSEVVIGFDVEALTVEKDETFSISLVIENIPSDHGMGGLEFVVTWDSPFLNGLNMTDVVFRTCTPQEEQDNIWRIMNNVTASRASYAYTWFDMNRAIEIGYCPISGNKTIATITLKATTLGSANLRVNVIKIGSENGDPLVSVSTFPFIYDSILNFYLADCKVSIKALKADVDADGGVNLFDAMLMAKSFGSVPGKHDWNPNCDLNNDRTIDIYDMILLAKSFGKAVPS
jgi:parallel beta-helix repeat protein